VGDAQQTTANLMADPSFRDYRVTLADLDVPFGRLVVFFIKVGLAMIPALIIVYAVLVILAMIAGFIFGWPMWRFGMRRWD
jgi:hypothetical protein